ncbi:MAG: DEAD/DEAH box helicase family protein [Planctomycetia bacterium]|nr:DEAD/DEAH box helicase family protein [Planctomycetia bacterium]
MLLEYDQNIVSHTLRISRRREGFRWKYFQYMALLFTEIYLDKYFQNPQKFLVELNNFVTQFNRDKEPGEQVESYTSDDLNKIAFWQATGSGKTLIMHVNILQYHYYLKKYGRQNEVNRTILLTPNEGLSEQHRREFLLSGMDAELFNKDAMGLFRSNAIRIIDVHKLKEESGKRQWVWIVLREIIWCLLTRDTALAERSGWISGIDCEQGFPLSIQLPLARQ